MSAVNPALHEMVPGYAFRSNPPVRSFQREGRDMPSYFSTVTGETTSEIVGAFFIPQNTPRNGWR